MASRSGKHHPGSAARLCSGAAVVCMAFGLAGVAAADETPAELSQLSLEELGNIEISSVSRRPESLADAPAAIFVLTREDIRRSGATSLPEVLRLVPNLEVAQRNSSTYGISARGFNISNANKLLVLIDGRTVYTPLHAGVFWDAQDVMLEDIERIEVISGPGGALWGSNAVNGVINITTRSSADTQGTLVTLGSGNAESGAGVRYGGKLGEDGSFRLYAKGFRRDDTKTATGASVHDAWNRSQAGFRADWGKPGDGITLQGDVYDGASEQATAPDSWISGGNLLARWTRALEDGASVQVQAYYDRTKREVPGLSGFGEVRDTYDIDVQHHFRWGERHDIVWGGGYRSSRDTFTNGFFISFQPDHENLKYANLFGQDTITLRDDLKLTVGAKFEHNSYTGWESQPNVRLAWKPNDHSLLWGAVSRAVRTPSRVDRDFFITNFPAFPLRGGPDFVSEKLTAYEIGYRAQPTLALSYSVSAFYNDYHRLRTVETLPGGAMVIANNMAGHTNGIETWGSYRVNDRWRLSAGYSYLKKRLHLEEGSTDTSSIAGANADPGHQFMLRSSWDLPHQWELDIGLRAVSGLPSANVPRYVAVDARIGWHLNKTTTLSLTGTNLADDRHLESSGSSSNPASALRPAWFLKLDWTP